MVSPGKASAHFFERSPPPLRDGSVEYPRPQQSESGATVHLPLEKLETVDLTFVCRDPYRLA